MRRFVLFALAFVLVAASALVAVNFTAKAECVPLGNRAAGNPCAPGDPLSAAPKDQFTTDGRVVAKGLNVRSGPGAKFTAPTQLRRGDKIRFIGRTNNGLGDWVGVAAYDRKSGQVVLGWVWDPLVTNTGDFALLTTAAGTITVRDLTVRSQRSTVVNDDNQGQVGALFGFGSIRFQTR